MSLYMIMSSFITVFNSTHNFTINKCNMVDDIPETIELASEVITG